MHEGIEEMRAMYMLINGKWIDRKEKIEVFNPYTGRVVGRVPKAKVKDISEAIEKAKKAKIELTAYERYQLLYDCAQEIKIREEEFSRLITEEAGICIKSSTHELKRAYQALILSAEEAKRIYGETIPADVTPGVRDKYALTFREPVGLVVAITPFNHPLNQIVHKIGPSIAAGNRMILKPSEKTPLTALLFGEVLMNNGMLPSMVDIVTGDPGEIGDELLTNPLVDMITFTGGVEVGELIAKKAGIKKLCLELGGNGALIVCEDADVGKAVDVAVRGAFSNSGQRCTSIKRIILIGNVADEFVEKFVIEVKKLRFGDPFDHETDVGTVIDEEATRRLERVVDSVIKDGAELLVGGKRKGALFAPTVLDFVSPTSEIVVKETFGPTAPIIRVKSIDEAIEITNSTIYGLQAGVMTDSIENAFRIARSLKVGGVVINEGPGFRIESLPFGGVKKSGIGREGIRCAIREMTNIKTIVL